MGDDLSLAHLGLAGVERQRVLLDEFRSAPGGLGSALLGIEQTDRDELFSADIDSVVAAEALDLLCHGEEFVVELLAQLLDVRLAH